MPGARQGAEGADIPAVG